MSQERNEKLHSSELMNHKLYTFVNGKSERSKSLIKIILIASTALYFIKQLYIVLELQVIFIILSFFKF